jgi:sulfate permease, SulP family
MTIDAVPSSGRPSLPPSSDARALARQTVRSWKAMFRGETLGADLSAALTVAMVGLPLNLALAVACGLPPHAGLLSAAAGGAVAALFGSGRLHITGPEVALAPMTLVIASQHGLGGLVIATVLAGLMQIAFGVMRLGGIVRAVPRPVVGGFLAAVGILVFDGQLPRLLGLEGVARLSQIRDLALLDVHPGALAVGALVIALFVGLGYAPRWVPAPLVALGAGVIVTAVMDLPVQRIEPIEGSSLLPAMPDVSLVSVLHLLPSALSLALLSSLDSLLCAVSIDARTGERHQSDQELVAQGLANLASGMIGGMPVAAAVVRSVVAVESRAETRLASLAQSVLMLGVVLALGAHLDHIPLAALAGVLLVVGAKLVQVSELRALWRLSRAEAAVFVATALAILTLDFVEGVVAGVALSLAVLARQMRDGLRGRIDEVGRLHVLELSGALFSASHDRLRPLIEAAVGDARELLIDVRDVPVLDASGVAALRGALAKLGARGISVRIAGVPAGRIAPLAAALGDTAAGVHGTRDEALRAFAPDGREPAKTMPPRARPRPSIETSLAAE